MKNMVCFLGAAAFSFAFVSPSGAQDYSLEYLSTAPVTVSGAPSKGLLFGAEDIFVELHGFLNFEAYNFQRRADHPGTSFDLHNWYFAAKVEPARDVHLFAELEYEHGTEAIKLDRAFIDWDVFSAATLRFGRFNSQASYERNNYQAPVRPMTSRPLPTNVAMHEWSDTGLSVYGFPIPGAKWLQYDVSLLNGPRGLSEDGIAVGVGDDSRDNNNDKTFVARMNFFPFNGFRAGTAWASGKYDDAGDLGFKIFELDSRYTCGPLDVMGEYMRRTGDDEPAPVATNPYITGEKAGLYGWYMLVGYELLRNRPHINYLKPVLRYDTVKYDSSGSGFKRYTVGLNYSPAPHFVVKSEYQVVRETGQARIENDGAMLSVVVDF